MRRLKQTQTHTFACAVFAVLSGCAVSLADTGPSEMDQVSVASWQLVWEDEFNGSALDGSKWAPEVSCWGGGNNERQCYTDREVNVQVNDGVLHLKAIKEDYTAQLYPAGWPVSSDETRTQHYTSGKVRSLGLAEWQFGRFSAKMKLPAGQGPWPAFWMMPSEGVYGHWPLSGEIDILEAVNLETPCADCPGGIERRTSGAVHFGGAMPDNTYLYLNTVGDEDVGPSQDWRTYTLEWAEGTLQWFADGEPLMRVTSDEWYTVAKAAEGRPHAPFDQPFYIMLNLAVGGNLAERKNGAGFDPDAFPAELLIDWVRVEQCEGDETGRACLTEANWSRSPMGPWETLAR